MLASGLGEMYELEESERCGARVHRVRDRARPRLRLHPQLARGRRSSTTDAGTKEPRSRRSSSPTTISAISRITALSRSDAFARDAAIRASPTRSTRRSSVAAGGHLQRLGHVHAARAEAAWLAGDTERTLEEARAVYDLALEKRHLWFAGELAYWQWKAGALDAAPGLDRRALREADRRRLRAVPPTRGPRTAASTSPLARWPRATTRTTCARRSPSSRSSAPRPAAQTVRQSLRSLGARSHAVHERRRARTRPRSRHASSKSSASSPKGCGTPRSPSASSSRAEPSITTCSAILRKLDARTRGEAVAEAPRLGLFATVTKALPTGAATITITFVTIVSSKVAPRGTLLQAEDMLGSTLGCLLPDAAAAARLASREAASAGARRLDRSSRHPARATQDSRRRVWSALSHRSPSARFGPGLEHSLDAYLSVRQRQRGSRRVSNSSKTARRCTC